MVELLGLKMQGIRSIGEQPHIIEFLHPLTIIQGPNGTGKTVNYFFWLCTMKLK